MCLFSLAQFSLFAHYLSYCIYHNVPWWFLLFQVLWCQKALACEGNSWSFAATTHLQKMLWSFILPQKSQPTTNSTYLSEYTSHLEQVFVFCHVWESIMKICVHQWVMQHLKLNPLPLDNPQDLLNAIILFIRFFLNH